MDTLQTLVEEELTQAVEVKDTKSLHRAVVMLTENMARRNDYELLAHETESKFDKLLAVMTERFNTSDKRFDDMNRRFEDTNKRFEDTNKRFDDVNKRFDDTNKHMDQRFADVNNRFIAMQWVIGLGFTVLAAMMTLYKVL